MEYEFSGIRRLMAAVVLRAVRDVYASDAIARYTAKEWLRVCGLDYVHMSGLNISVFRFERWLDEDFPLERLTGLRTEED